MGKFKLGKSVDTLFKSGNSESGNKYVPNKPVIRKTLEEGIKAEANKEGTTFVDPSVDLNSEEGRNILAHEEAHHQQYADNYDTKKRKIVKSPSKDTVKLFDYNDKFVFWKGEKIPRKGMVEGEGKLAWEQDAEKRVNSIFKNKK